MKQICILLSLALLAASFSGCNRQTAPPQIESPIVSQSVPSTVISNEDTSQFPLPELTPDGPAPWEEWEDELESLLEEESHLPPQQIASAPSDDETPVQQPAAQEAENAASRQAGTDDATPPGNTARGLMQPASSNLSTEAIELELLRLINRERESAGLTALGLEESMHWAARMRAPETMSNLSHTRPNGTPYYTAFDEAGFPYAGKYHGENVSTMFFPTGTYTAETAARNMFEALKGSSGHYQNMLSENFDQAGIGVSLREEDGTTYLASAQLFSSF